MRASELRNLTGDELGQRLEERKKDVTLFRMQQATGVVENVCAAKEARKDIARIMTILKEREMGAKTATSAKGNS
mgnify:CR=1 FL=1